MTVHPENINHVGRDLVYLAAILNLGLKNGYDVLVPPSFATDKKLVPWGRAILKALQRRGLRFADWEDEAQRFGKVAIRLPKDERADHTSNRSTTADFDAAPCGIVCVTQSVRHGNTGFMQPEDAVTLHHAVLESCDLPLDPPATRSLLLITRTPGGTRALANLKEVAEVLKPFVEKHGLKYNAVNLGNLPICEQVRLASEAYIMIGIQGADPMNMIFQHGDASFIEMYARKFGWTLNTVLMARWLLLCTHVSTFDTHVTAGDPNYFNNSHDKASRLYHHRPHVATSTYMAQLAAAGRRGAMLKLFNQTNCSSWMYSRTSGGCVLTLDVHALIAHIRAFVPMPKRNSTLLALLQHQRNHSVNHRHEGHIAPAPKDLFAAIRHFFQP